MKRNALPKKPGILTGIEMTAPGPEAGKKERVQRMFDGIARRYDFLNHFLSMGTDRRWRRRAVEELLPHQPKNILDMATGTGDMALALLRLNPEHVLGIDLSGEMLKIGHRKIRRKHVEHIIRLEQADSQQSGLPGNAFDAVTAAFGVRNFEDVPQGLQEMVRLLRPGGMAVILEFSQPEPFPVKQLYRFYFRKILPFFGKMISGDAGAYAYLPQSVSVFPYGDAFIRLMREAGFADTKYKSLSFGIAAIYTGIKPQ